MDSTVSPPLDIHKQGEIWLATAGVRTAMGLVAQDLQIGQRYIQINDASLRLGGAFTIHPDTTASGVLIDDPWRSHRSHAMGVDVDVGLCYAPVSGEDGQINRVSPDPECPQNLDVPPEDLEDAAFGRGLRVIGEGDHYHLRPFNTLTFFGLTPND